MDRPQGGRVSSKDDDMPDLENEIRKQTLT